MVEVHGASRSVLTTDAAVGAWMLAAIPIEVEEGGAPEGGGERGRRRRCRQGLRRGGGNTSRTLLGASVVVDRLLLFLLINRVKVVNGALLRSLDGRREGLESGKTSRREDGEKAIGSADPKAAGGRDGKFFDVVEGDDRVDHHFHDARLEGVGLLLLVVGGLGGGGEEGGEEGGEGGVGGLGRRHGSRRSRRRHS